MQGQSQNFQLFQLLNQPDYTIITKFAQQCKHSFDNMNSNIRQLESQASPIQALLKKIQSKSTQERSYDLLQITFDYENHKQTYDKLFPEGSFIKLLQKKIPPKINISPISEILKIESLSSQKISEICISFEDLKFFSERRKTRMQNDAQRQFTNYILEKYITGQGSQTLSQVPEFVDIDRIRNILGKNEKFKFQPVLQQNMNKQDMKSILKIKAITDQQYEEAKERMQEEKAKKNFSNQSKQLLLMLEIKVLQKKAKEQYPQKKIYMKVKKNNQLPKMVEQKLLYFLNENVTIIHDSLTAYTRELCREHKINFINHLNQLSDKENQYFCIYYPIKFNFTLVWKSNISQKYSVFLQQRSKVSEIDLKFGNDNNIIGYSRDEDYKKLENGLLSDFHSVLTKEKHASFERQWLAVERLVITLRVASIIKVVKEKKPLKNVSISLIDYLSVFA